MKLSQRDVVLVTGGASGLGAATVRALVGAGGQAVIVDLPSSRGEQLAAELGDRVHFAAADVRDEEQVQAAVDQAVALGTLRVVVNCAGVATPGRIVGRRGVLPLGDFRTVVEINLVGTFNVLRLAAAAMRGNTLVDGDRGVVVMTASVAAFDGQVGQAAYAASKGGVAALTLSAARDLADQAIRVMTIAPRGDGDTDDGGPARGHPGSARGHRAAPVAAGPALGVCAAGRGDHHQPAAQRGGHPAGRRAADASALGLPTGAGWSDRAQRLAAARARRAAMSRYPPGLSCSSSSSTSVSSSQGS